MNQEQYLDSNGCLCPNCGGDDIRGYAIDEYGLTSANRPCVCYECEAEWTEEFELTGYSNLILRGEDGEEIVP